MDSIASAIIGAIATISAVIMGWWLQQKRPAKWSPAKVRAFEPDADDIYFMTFLLHDAYEEGATLSTTDLAQHHLKYAPLELEVKLIRLEKNGYIRRTNKKTGGIGSWQMLPRGVEFMFAHGHQLQHLIEEQRDNA